MRNTESDTQNSESVNRSLKPTNARGYLRWLLQPIVYAVTSPFTERRIANKAKRAIEEYERTVGNRPRE